MSSHDPIFDQFPVLDVTVPTGFIPDFSGTVVDPRLFDPNAEVTEADRHLLIAPPTCTGEGYFDLVAVAHAVVAARDRFTIVELGAGYGYWLSQGGGLAQRRGLTPRLVGVEADPGHFGLMKRHLEINRYRPDQCHLIEAAVAPSDGTVCFTVGPEWGWGQTIVDSLDFQQEGISGRVVKVPAISLNTVLADLASVDLLHMDIQGVEYDVLEAAKSEVDAKVAFLVVGTHSTSIEEKLRELFRNWRCMFDFSLGRTYSTPYGDVSFGDGVQVWVNPNRQPD